VLLQLQARGEQLVAIDNLSAGFRQAGLSAPLIVGDIGNRGLVAAVLRGSLRQSGRRYLR
jgi:UDP-glucose 4-epimerase